MECFKGQREKILIRKKTLAEKILRLWLSRSCEYSPLGYSSQPKKSLLDVDFNLKNSVDMIN